MGFGMEIQQNPKNTRKKPPHLIHFWPQKEWPRLNTDSSTLTLDLHALQ